MSNEDKNVRNFNGKVVLITGSSSGIGAVTAIEFAKCGAQVVINGRNAAKLSQVAKQCSKVSPKCFKTLEVIADIANEEDCRQLIDTTIKAFGKLDILVNNAGIGAINFLNDSQILNTFDRLMRTNLRSIVYLCHLCCKHLEKTKGNIVNISSIAGLKPVFSMSIYCLTKSALDMWTKCLALELAPKKIRVNSVNAANVRTNFCAAMGVNGKVVDIMESGAKSYPLGRIAESIDISNAVLFLASDESSFVTGINFVSDGGSLNAFNV